MLFHLISRIPGPVIVLYLLKLYRMMVLWLVVAGIKDYYADAFVRSVYIHGASSPPSLLTFVPVVMGIEGAAFALPMLTAYIMYYRYKSYDNAFVIDYVTLRRAIVDYVVSTTVIVLVGLVITSVVQSRSLFRYKDDGVRGIRAAGDAFLLSAFVLLLPPYFLLVS